MKLDPMRGGSCKEVEWREGHDPREANKAAVQVADAGPRKGNIFMDMVRQAKSQKEAVDKATSSKGKVSRTRSHLSSKIRSDLFGFDMTFDVIKGDSISEAARYQQRLLEHRQHQVQEALEREHTKRVEERRKQLEAVVDSAGKEIRIQALAARIGRWWRAKARWSSVLRRASP